jgi:hypothetical protein
MFMPNNITIVIGYCVALGKAGVEINFTNLVTNLLPTLATFMIFFYGGTIYVMNAISDIEDDRKEKPYRPLPAGKMTQAHALLFAGINLLLSLTGAFNFGGETVFFVFVAFFVINFVYSFVLRPWMSIVVPLIFISVTLPLRLYLGSAIAGYALPWLFYALAYQIYIGLQFMRKVIIQKKIQVRRTFLRLVGCLRDSSKSPLLAAILYVASIVHVPGSMLDIATRSARCIGEGIPARLSDFLPELCIRGFFPVAPRICERAVPDLARSTQQQLGVGVGVGVGARGR